nr:virulence RhuM family protein [Sphingopyxis sp. PET50]
MAPGHLRWHIRRPSVSLVHFLFESGLRHMPNLEPVRLQEDETTGDRFLVYGDGTGLHVELSYDGDQLWMTQAQIAELFGRDVSVISRHIASILEEGELDEATSLQKMQKSLGRPTTLYNLDMVISVGYRVSSKQATLFRKWATEKLVQFATKGFVIDAVRLKNPDNRDRIAELKEIVRDIRSDEANVYRELRSICAMCQDYDGASPTWRDFYRNTQAKLIYAVCSNTPAEVLRLRADAEQPNMGLQSWPNENIRKADAGDIEKLSGGAGNQGIEPAHDHFARYLRGPDGHRTPDPDERCGNAFGCAIIQSGPRRAAFRRKRVDGRSNTTCRTRICDVQGSAEATASRARGSRHRRDQGGAKEAGQAPRLNRRNS